MGACSDDQPQPDFSAAFYRHHAQRYADVSHQFLQSVYIKSSHAALQGDRDLQERLKELVPGQRGLGRGLWGWSPRCVSLLAARVRHPRY